MARAAQRRRGVRRFHLHTFPAVASAGGRDRVSRPSRTRHHRIADVDGSLLGAARTRPQARIEFLTINHNDLLTVVAGLAQLRGVTAAYDHREYRTGR